MNLTDILAQAGGIESMAKELGIPPAMAKQGADALLPAILGGFKKQAQSGGGAADGLGGLGGLLGQLGGGGLLDSVLAPQPTPVNQGNEVLGQIFGSKDVSRTVAGQAAAQHGNDKRSEERREGKECVSTCRSRGAAYHKKKKTEKN